VSLGGARSHLCELGELFAIDNPEPKLPPLSNIKLTLINVNIFLFIHSLLEELTQNKPKGEKNSQLVGGF
jgi:hypothetical protein